MDRKSLAAIAILLTLAILGIAAAVALIHAEPPANRGREAAKLIACMVGILMTYWAYDWLGARIRRRIKARSSRPDAHESLAAD